MARVSLTTVAAVIPLVLADPIHRQYRKDSVLFNLIRKRRVANATAVWTAKFETSGGGGAYTPGAARNDSEAVSERRVQATLSWANYREFIDVADETIDIIAATGGSEGSDLLMTESRDAVTRLGAKVGAAVYAGDVTASPVELGGLAAAIASSGAYAGINPGTSGNEAWVSAADSIAVGDLSNAALAEKLHRPIINATGKRPEVVACQGALWDRVRNLQDANHDVHQFITINGNRVDITSASGSKAINIDGVWYVEDRLATANTFYALSLDGVEFQYVPGEAHDFAGVSTADMARVVGNLTGMVVTEADIVARLAALGGQMAPIMFGQGKDGTSTKFGFRTGNFQLCVTKRNAHAKLSVTGL